VKDSGWDEMEHILFVVDDYGMAGVVAALVAGDQISLQCKDIDYLSFSFIAPLGADNKLL